jgi:N-methylhydantoinase A
MVLLRSDGFLVSLKVSSDSGEPERAVLAGLQMAVDRAGLKPDQISEVAHGTMVGSNALLQGSAHAAA